MIYDQSWYDCVLAERIDGLTKKSALPGLYDEIVSFERQLTDSGCVMIKFFLHITKKEQKKRFEKLENDPATKWRVGAVEWKRHRKYREFKQIMEEVLSRTDTEKCEWTPVAAIDRRFAAIKICETVASALEQRITEVEKASKRKPEAAVASTAKKEHLVSVLDKIDLSKAGIRTITLKSCIAGAASCMNCITGPITGRSPCWCCSKAGTRQARAARSNAWSRILIRAVMR